MPCVLVDQDTCFVFLAMSSDGHSGWTGSAVVLLSVSKEASDLVGVGVLVFSSHGICVGTSYLWVMDYECVPQFRSVTAAAAFEQGSLHTLPKALLPVVMES